MPKSRDGLLKVLKARFDAHMQRHAGINWSTVQARLESHSAKLSSLDAMEQSGGEPDVVGIDQSSGACLFMDCSTQSPSGRRSLCYDAEALASRKENKPKGSAVAMATAMGATLLTIDEYKVLQQLGEFDTATRGVKSQSKRGFSPVAFGRGCGACAGSGLADSSRGASSAQRDGPGHTRAIRTLGCDDGSTSGRPRGARSPRSARLPPEASALLEFRGPRRSGERSFRLLSLVLAFDSRHHENYWPCIHRKNATRGAMVPGTRSSVKVK
jgi:hypothetical protein